MSPHLDYMVLGNRTQDFTHARLVRFKKNFGVGTVNLHKLFAQLQCKSGPSIALWKTFTICDAWTEHTGCMLGSTCQQRIKVQSQAWAMLWPHMSIIYIPRLMAVRDTTLEKQSSPSSSIGYFLFVFNPSNKEVLAGSQRLGGQLKRKSCDYYILG